MNLTEYKPDALVRVKRRCDILDHGGGVSNYPHYWERLNKDTHEPFKRGRVVFFCEPR